jgi:CubicO group peptidase (beta-lactamase class C family)
MAPDARSSIEELRRSARVPGCSIAVVNDSGTLWSEGFGLADLQQRTPATAATVYRLFSGTKLFTAVAVLQLAERGLLDIDERLTTYLPEYPSLSGVRVIHLLSHRSGLKDTLRGFLSVYFPSDVPPSTGEALSRYRLALARPPGERVEYRNVNYALLGEVVTRVSGTPYRDFVHANLLAPLAMDVGFDLTEEQRTRAATGYIGRWDPMRAVLRIAVPTAARRIYRGRVGSQFALNEYGLASAAIGGLVGGVTDFARFLQAQLSHGEGILARRSTETMQTMLAAGQPGIESRDGVGLGWKFGTAQSGRFLNHEGGGAGFTSELRMYPDQGIGIALAMNAMRMPNTMRTAHAMCEALLSAGIPQD